MNETLLSLYSRKRVRPAQSQYPSFYTLLAIMNQATLEAAPVYSPYDSNELSIEFAEPHLRMREVVRRSNYRATGKFPSRKNGRMMHWESPYELAAFLILEVSSHVRSYQEQPAEIRFLSDSGRQTHFPDILVGLISGNQVFVEVKPTSMANDYALSSRTQRLKSLLSPRGYRYVMVLPEQLESEAYLENAKHLLLHWKPFMSIAPWEKVRNVMHKKNQMPLAQLLQALAHADARTWVSQFLLNGTLLCDLSKPLRNESIIAWVGNGGGV